MPSLPKTLLLSSAAAAALLTASSAPAQRQQPSPDQRIGRLERQVQQMQRQVYPKGRPVDTAGFLEDPAATQASVVALAQRLDALEKQMSDLLRQTEENNNLLRTTQSDIAESRRAFEGRLSAVERQIAEGLVAAPATTAPSTPASPAAGSAVPIKSKPQPAPPLAISGDAPAPGTAAPDPGEEAYTIGFKQWQAGDYDRATASLKSFLAAYPNHRRASFARNLIGRSLLDKGNAREAANVLLDNYRKNPRGERAPDSLYYLGQALMKLGQPGQACKAYAELEAVYGSKVRSDLAKLVQDGKAQAQC